MLEITGLTKTFTALGRPPVTALDDVRLRVPGGSVTGLVGESGSGKSTLLRILLRLEQADRGSVEFDGTDVLRLRGKQLRAYRRRVQMVFQDPMGSLNPRMNVEQIIEEGMLIHHRRRDAGARRRRVRELLAMVGLDPDDARRRPASFSGGQRQRIAIARALAVEPDLLVCDEPVSALDVSVQAQVLNVLRDMQAELGLTILFVAHDLAVVRYLCPRIAVLEKGRIVEERPRHELFDSPEHPYTRQLLAAVPVPDPDAPRRTATSEGGAHAARK
jgi:peptide/nickel transport system ATP-binding protein/oligopeptide transport system ATP-binding protein